MKNKIKNLQSPSDSIDLKNKLRFSEIRYRRLFETACDGILILNGKTAVIDDINPYLIKMLNYTRDELLGKKLWEIGPFKNTSLTIDAFAELQKNNYIRYDDLPLETKDGRHVSVEFISNVYDCDGIDIIQCNIRDNTKRNIAEIALKVTTRALKILSEGNVAILEAETEQNLLNEYCRISVETGGYVMAWIGFAENNNDKIVKPIAYYGDKEYFWGFKSISWDDSEVGDCPISRSIKTMDVQVCENIATDPTMETWREEALENGVNSLIVIPFYLPEDQRYCLILYGSIYNVWSSPELKLLQEFAADLSYGIKALRTAISKAKHQEQLILSLEQTIQVIAETIGQRDSYTAGHQRRVADICKRIGEEIELSEDRIQGLLLAATIHDVGKIGIPAEILVKSTRLSEIEYGLIKEHVNIGLNILKNVYFPWPIAKIIAQHHERMDGSGYPLGLKGDELILESKILAVADVVEAMASHRPYRPALGIQSALKEIISQRGILYDHTVVDACIRIFRKKNYKIIE